MKRNFIPVFLFSPFCRKYVQILGRIFGIYQILQAGAAHRSSAHGSASSGAAVKKGEKLGEVGETGMATGPHLHFELQKDGVYLNPIYYVETA